MNQLERRGFLKGLGVSGLFVAGVAGYNEVKERIVYKQDELPTKELEEQLNGKPVLQLTATYGEEIPHEKIPGYPYTFVIGPQYKEGTMKNVSVNIVPGPDGKLYVKENDSWRKI